MTTHSEHRVIAAPCALLFDLVADVERYPEFLPMWKEAHIHHRTGNRYSTDQEVGFGFLCERFTTRTALYPPDAIEVTSDDALFRKFLIRWRFEEMGEGACRVTIHLEWYTHSPMLQRAIDLVLPQTARTMIEAFERRALDRVA